MTEERIKELADEHFDVFDWHFAQRTTRGLLGYLKILIRAVAAEAREEGIEEMRPGIQAVENLIASSGGVAGLHLNGDIAPWSDLLTGGRYEEWLIDFDRAVEWLKEKE